MDRRRRLKLSGKHLLIHYSFIPLILLTPISSMISIIQIWTGNYDGVRTIDDHVSVSIPFLLIGVLFAYRQYRRLDFKEFTIDHSDKDFQHALGMTGMELKWRTERNRDGYYRAHRVGEPVSLGWWGEMITIISDNKRILINSVSDPNQSPTLSSFGWDRKNVRTFIRNLQTIVTENRERTNKPTANSGIA